MPTTTGLLFYLAEEIADDAVEWMRLLIEQLARARTWSIMPPRFVDEVDSSGEEPIRTVGGVLEISAADASRSADPEEERRQLEEVTSIVDGLRELTREFSTDVELYLGNTYVGDIREGRVGSTLQRGLLDEWSKHLGDVK